MRSHDSGRTDGTDQREDFAVAVFGGAGNGLEIARRQADTGMSVSYFDERVSLLRPAADDGITTGLVTLDELDSLTCTNAAEADVVVVAGRTDRRNLLLTQLLRTGVDVEEVVLRVNRAENVDAFDAIDVHTVQSSGDVVAEIFTAVEAVLDRTESARS